jgi:hypothetical protein
MQLWMLQRRNNLAARTLFGSAFFASPQCFQQFVCAYEPTSTMQIMVGIAGSMRPVIISVSGVSVAAAAGS